MIAAFPAARLTRATKQARFVWPYGVLAVLLYGVMWPAWTTGDQIVVGSDLLSINYPLLVLWRDALARGEFPFWNPYTLSGSPAFADLHAGYAYPFTIALTWLPPMVAANWTLGLHVLLAGLGAAWCAGRMGATAEGQVLSGVAYALGSALTARLWAGQLGFVEASAWLPWATGTALRMRNLRSAAALGLVVGLMALAGLPELLIFSIWWLPLWAAAAAIITGGSRDTSRWVVSAVSHAIRAGFGVGLGLGLAAFQLVPALVVLSVSNRAVGMSWDFQTMTSLPPWHLLTLIAPLVFGDPRMSYWPGQDFEWHERLLYVGIVPLMAAMVVPSRWRWLCLGTAALAVALALGRYAPWYGWTQVLPGYGSFRIPSKHLTLAALSLALAAGLGLERLRGRRVALGSFVVSAALLAFAMAPDLDRLRELAAGPLEAASLLLLAGGLASLLPPRWGRKAFVVLAFVDLTVLFQPFRLAPQDPRTILYQAYGLNGYTRAAVIGAWDVNVGNFGPVLHVTQPSGYTALFSSGYAELVTGDPNPNVFVRVKGVDDPALEVLGYQAVFDNDARALTVMQPPPSRMWVARCAWPGGAAEVRNPRFPRQICVTRSGTSDPEAPVTPGPADVVAEGNSWLQIDASGPGWLMTGEPYYPGWSAEVDSQMSAIEVLDGAIVGVFVPPGLHVIRLQYSPGGLGLGLLLSSVAAMASLGMWVVPCLRRSRAPTLNSEFSR